MWPLVVALDWGVWCLRLFELRPGKPEMKLLSSAVWRVDRTGMNKAVWLKATC